MMVNTGYQISYCFSPISHSTWNHRHFTGGKYVVDFENYLERGDPHKGGTMEISGIQGMGSLSSAGQMKAATPATEESRESPAEKARELSAQNAQQKSMSLQSWQGNHVNLQA